jgi:glycosyltransferase involved in cell wall biosynthesis
MPKTSDILYIIIPAYNEEENIELVIEQWYPIVADLNPDSRLVIIDDGSTDGTCRLVSRKAKQRGQLKLLRKENTGHGPSCYFGYRYAIEQGADFVFQTDSDGQTNPGHFESFWRERDKFDFIFGYRQKRRDGLIRIMVTNILRLTLLVIARVNVKDANVPYRLMRAEALGRYLRRIPPDFFLSNALLAALITKDKRKIKWLPIGFGKRRKGKNKIKLFSIAKIGLSAVVAFVRQFHIRKDRL